MNSPRTRVVIDLTTRTEPLHYKFMRQATSVAGEAREFHAIVRADQTEQVMDIPGFVPASSYGRLRIRPQSAFEMGFVENVRIFGPDYAIHPDPSLVAPQGQN